MRENVVERFSAPLFPSLLCTYSLIFPKHNILFDSNQLCHQSYVTHFGNQKFTSISNINSSEMLLNACGLILRLPLVGGTNNMLHIYPKIQDTHYINRLATWHKYKLVFHISCIRKLKLAKMTNCKSIFTI